MRKIGILGGTFDPIHVGHLMLAEYAKSEFGLDEVWFIPTGCSYMKSNKHITTGSQRLALVNIAIENHKDYFKVLDIEVFREGNTYTYETIEYLNAHFPEDKFYFIMGADCLFDIYKWKYPEKIFSGCKIIAAIRNDADKGEMMTECEKLENLYHADIHFLPFIRMELSSTQIRERVRNRKSIRYMVPDQVADYIDDKGLYLDEKNC